MNMLPDAPIFNDSRGSSELVYVVMIIAFVIAVAGAGITVGSAITSTTETQVQEQEFSVTDPVRMEVEYASSNTLSADSVSKVYALDESGGRTTIYDSSKQGIDETINTENQTSGAIQEGDIVFNKTLAIQGGMSADYGETIEFVVEDHNGDTYVADEVFIPPKAAIATRTLSNGSAWVNNSENIDSEENIDVEITTVEGTTTTDVTVTDTNTS